MPPIEYIGVFIPILAITLGMGLGAIGMWTQHKQKLIKLEIQRVQAQAALSAGAAGENGERIDELEDRLRVLERIVTDRGIQTAEQIDALMDSEREPEQIR